MYLVSVFVNDTNHMSLILPLSDKCNQPYVTSRPVRTDQVFFDANASPDDWTKSSL